MAADPLDPEEALREAHEAHDRCCNGYHCGGPGPNTRDLINRLARAMFEAGRGYEGHVRILTARDLPSTKRVIPEPSYLPPEEKQ